MDKNQNVKFKIFGVSFTLNKSTYFPLLFKVLLGLALLLLVSVLFFEYQMTTSDIPGGIISGFLLTYLIHIIQN